MTAIREHGPLSSFFHFYTVIQTNLRVEHDITYVAKIVILRSASRNNKKNNEVRNVPTDEA